MKAAVRKTQDGTLGSDGRFRFLPKPQQGVEGSVKMVQHRPTGEEFVIKEFGDPDFERFDKLTDNHIQATMLARYVGLKDTPYAERFGNNVLAMERAGSRKGVGVNGLMKYRLEAKDVLDEAAGSSVENAEKAWTHALYNQIADKGDPHTGNTVFWVKDGKLGIAPIDLSFTLMDKGHHDASYGGVDFRDMTQIAVDRLGLERSREIANSVHAKALRAADVLGMSEEQRKTIQNRVGSFGSTPLGKLLETGKMPEPDEFIF